ncbi:transducin/WD40 repeat-like superfamily protein [Striga asiatica]|uniref:Transducin/WD40 repeat-like superfamily protein n=1 Tax=Striga asiatica TaxID=4170 RepID=A0A5A7PTY4_STRAF|nr:transducin/WD40 repeat-like superfamily protein [Striga asiatica]
MVGRRKEFARSAHGKVTPRGGRRRAGCRSRKEDETEHRQNTSRLRARPNDLTTSTRPHARPHDLDDLDLAFTLHDRTPSGKFHLTLHDLAFTNLHDLAGI